MEPVRPEDTPPAIPAGGGPEATTVVDPEVAAAPVVPKKKSPWWMAAVITVTAFVIWSAVLMTVVWLAVQFRPAVEVRWTKAYKTVTTWFAKTYQREVPTQTAAVSNVVPEAVSATNRSDSDISAERALKQMSLYVMETKAKQTSMENELVEKDRKLHDAQDRDQKLGEKFEQAATMIEKARRSLQSTGKYTPMSRLKFPQVSPEINDLGDLGYASIVGVNYGTVNIGTVTVAQPEPTNDQVAPAPTVTVEQPSPSTNDPSVKLDKIWQTSRTWCVPGMACRGRSARISWDNWHDSARGIRVDQGWSVVFDSSINCFDVIARKHKDDDWITFDPDKMDSKAFTEYMFHPSNRRDALLTFRLVR